jgi:hypothetical protein
MRQGACAGLLALAGILLGCVHAHAKREEAPVVRRLAYVDEVKCPPTVRAGGDVPVVVVGALPDPSWELITVEQQREGRVVRLSPWLRRKTEEPVVQMLVPFEHEVALAKLSPGHWEVQVAGYGDSLATAALDVRP